MERPRRTAYVIGADRVLRRPPRPLLFKAIVRRDRTQSLAAAVLFFLRSPDDYWETVCTAIAVGGDTDSTAAMAGAMSGARGGSAELPEGLLVRLTDRGEWGAGELTLLARDCAGISWG